MKKIVVILLGLFVISCTVNNQSSGEGVISLAGYPRPADFSHFEVFVGLTSGFTVTGWNGSAWTGTPNSPAEWNGTDKTLKTISSTEPILITGLEAGKIYYLRGVAVDRYGNRSAPGVETSCAAGDAPRSATLIVAAADASPASKAGADFVCDGIDDHIEIQAALDALVNLKGKVVLTEGTFHVGVDQIEISDGIALEGQYNASILKLPNGYTVSSGWMIIALSNSVIKNLILDGNKANIASNSQNGIATSDNTILKNLYIRNFDNIGIEIYNQRATVVECYITNCRRGISIRGSYALVEGCHVYQNHGYGIYITNGHNNIVSNNQAIENGYHGITIETEAVGGLAYANQICNNQVIGNGTSYDNAYSNIHIGGYGVTRKTYDNIIQGNICRRGTGTNRPAYGIRINDLYCENNLVANNDCYQSGITAGISNAGVNTNFGAGNRNNDGTWSTTPN